MKYVSPEEIRGVSGGSIPVGRFHKFICSDTGGLDFRYTASQKDNLYEIVIGNPHTQGFLSGPKNGKIRTDLVEPYRHIRFDIGEKHHLTDLSLVDLLDYIPNQERNENVAFEVVNIGRGIAEIRLYDNKTR